MSDTKWTAGPDENAIGTPWGPAVSFADAVVMYAMHNEICPLGIAQTARDQFETVQEMARKNPAPEMAEALEALVNEIMAEHGGGAEILDVHPDFSPEHYTLIQNARTALRKARGEKS